MHDIHKQQIIVLGNPKLEFHTCEYRILDLGNLKKKKAQELGDKLSFPEGRCGEVSLDFRNKKSEPKLEYLGSLNRLSSGFRRKPPWLSGSCGEDSSLRY